MREESVDWFLEFNRQWAEAILIQEEKNFILLSERERRRLSERAKGILPKEEDELFKEILSLPFFSCANFLQSDSEIKFLEKVSLLKRFGGHIPLSFTLSSLFAQSEEDVIELGRLFYCVRRIIGEEREPDIPEEFERRFRLLTALHEKFLARRPKVKEVSRSLKESLEVYTALGPKGTLNNFSLVLIEGYVLQSFGFDCQFQMVDDQMSLLITIDQKPINWEVAKEMPLSFSPIPGGQRVDFCRLLLYALCRFPQEDQSRRLKNLLFLYETSPTKESFDAPFAQEIAKLFFLEKNYIKAEDFANEAINLAPTSEGILPSYSLLGSIYTYREDFKRAVSVYQKALSIKPNEPEINSNLGAVYIRMGEREKAKLAFKTALGLSPKNFSALYNLGILFLAEGDYKNSLRCLEGAAKIDGKNPVLLCTLGQVYYEAAKHEGKSKSKEHLLKAERVLKKAIREGVNNATAWYNLGIVYREKGEKEKAVQALERAIRLNPNLLR